MIGWLTARRALLLVGSALLAVLTVAVFAGAVMRSTKISSTLCETTGGGRFVAIPGFPGERIDRRLLTDIRRLKHRYKIFITDGYSMDDVHATNGEHPIGLALDIVPNKAKGGTWADVSALARWAEPRQDRPREPFRWVGYNGDSGHGRGHHLHLSWSHTAVDPGHWARTVYTIRCPQKSTESEESPSQTGGTEGDSTDSTSDEGATTNPSGGIGGKLAPAVEETDGVDVDDR